MSTPNKSEDDFLICRQHQLGIGSELQRKYKIRVQANGRMTTYSLEAPKPIDGIKAGLGYVLRRAALYQAPFLPAYVIRRHRFESGRSCTDDIAEIERRHASGTEFQRRLKKLFDIG